MLPVIQIGPLVIQAYGLILLLGLWLGLNLSEKHAAQHKIKAEQLDNLILLALLSGLVGARLAYAAQNWSAFAPNLTSLISLNPGLLDPWGGLVTALLTALIYLQRKALPIWATLDALTPAFAVWLSALPLANLFSGDGFGAPAELPWSISLWGADRHPSQIYEMAAAAAILWITWPQFGQEPLAPAGRSFLRFAALSAGVRLFLEAFRGDSLLVFGGLRLAQVFAWLALAAALYGLTRLSAVVGEPGEPIPTKGESR